MSKAESDARKKADKELTDAQKAIEGLRESHGKMKKDLADARTHGTQAAREQEAAETQAKADREQAETLKNELGATQRSLNNTQCLLDDANRTLAFLEPMKWEDVKGKLKSARLWTLVFAWVCMVVAVVTLIFATSEIQKRQQLTRIIDAMVDDVQQELLSECSCVADHKPATDKQVTDGETEESDDKQSDTHNDETGELILSLADQLKKLKKIRSDIQLLVAIGTQQHSQSLPGIRDRLISLERPAISRGGAESEIGCLAGQSSDLLLSLIVILAGAIGAVIAAMRSGVLFTPRDLGLGLAAGLITFLVIRSGRSIFIMQASGVTFVLNPYASAFFGLASGIFTDRAYRLLMAVISKLIEKLQDAFKLDPAELQPPGKSATSPSERSSDSGRKDDSPNKPTTESS